MQTGMGNEPHDGGDTRTCGRFANPADCRHGHPAFEL